MTATFDRLRRVPRPVRRLLVAETFVAWPLLLVGYSTLVATGVVPTSLWAPVAIVLMGMAIVGLLTIYAYARDRAQLDAAGLDERQRQLATQSWALSYVVLAAVVVLVVGALAVYISFIGPVTLAMEQAAPWLVAIGVYMAVLPSAVLAWIEPEPPLEDVAS
ncbi:MAG TPA: hypothetical protein VIH00_12275 [Candidatus Limnocylindrales bacterium]